jgi:hypothetical protein
VTIHRSHKHLYSIYKRIVDFVLPTTSQFYPERNGDGQGLVLAAVAVYVSMLVETHREPRIDDSLTDDYDRGAR